MSIYQISLLSIAGYLVLATPVSAQGPDRLGTTGSSARPASGGMTRGHNKVGARGANGHASGGTSDGASTGANAVKGTGGGANPK